MDFKYEYESYTREIYNLNNLLTLLKLNERRNIRLYTESYSTPAFKEEITNLTFSLEGNKLTIGNITFDIDNIYDIQSGTWFGNWMLIKVQEDDFHTIGIVMHEQTDGVNQSFTSTEYWDKVVDDYNKRHGGITKEEYLCRQNDKE